MTTTTIENNDTNAIAGPHALLRHGLIQLGVVITYVVAAKIGFELEPASGLASVVWAPTGIAMAAVLYGGYRMLFAVAAGAFLANFLTSAPWYTCVGIAIGNSGEALATAFILRQIAGDRPFYFFYNMKDLMLYFGVAVILCPLFAACVGTASLLSGGLIAGGDLFRTWISWWFGDAVGALVVAPLILLWLEKYKLRAESRILEAASLGLLLTSACLVCFFGLGVNDNEVAYWITRPFIVVPFMIWAAIRFDRRGAALACFYVAAFAVEAAYIGVGPFTNVPLANNIFFVQGFVAVNTFASLFLAAAIAELRAHTLAHKLADLELITNRERLAFSQTAANIVSWEWNVTTGSIVWNGDMMKVYGRMLEDRVGEQDFFSSVHPDDVALLRTAVKDCVESGNNLDHEFRFIWPDGGVHWLAGKGKVYFDSSGSAIRMYGLNFDITEAKRVEEDLRTAKQAADAASAAKSLFLTNMSHEIRTPLGAILGFSELLKQGSQTEAERKEYLSTIQRNGNLLLNIINDILDLSKIEAGRLEIETSIFPLKELVDDMRAFFGMQAKEKGLTLNFEVAAGVPHQLRTDSLRLRQILLNIIGNAVKFTNKGTITMRVEPHAGGKLAFIVSDTGVGIAAEKVSKLFEPFTQADSSTTRTFGGTGLGLVLSRRLARALGGNVELLSSTLGSGSSFVVTVDPGKVEIMATEQKAQKQSLKTSGAESRVAGKQGALAGLRVLVVEDAPDNRLLLGRMLNIAGAEIETADNGKEALNKVANSDYDVVLMDLQMPVMDGYEAVKQLRSTGYQRPIIALTAHAMREERQRCIESGFNDHLTKPIDRSKLLSQLERYGYGSQAVNT